MPASELSPGSSPAAPTQPYDAIVVGGGLIGALQAIAFGLAGLRVAMLERSNPASMLDASFDGRTTALSLATRRMYGALGLWEAVAAHAGPIREIRISDSASDGRPSLLHLHFDHRDGARDGETAEPMGWIVENRLLRRALFERLAEIPNVEIMAPVEIASIERSDERVHIRLADGRSMQAPLVASCEGRGAGLRSDAGIAVLSRRYSQLAIVCTIRHELPHHGIAHEKFLPAGPFAILPMTDDSDGVHRCSIVWTERPDIAAAVMALDEHGFVAELRRRVGTHLGHVEPIGPRFNHALGLLHAGRYVERRLALVGDAAHGIHPIAGQGYNLGARDVAALAETVVEAKRLGLDHGAADVLGRYERWRRFDNTTLVASTDLLNWLFSNNIAPLRLVRDIGLALVNRAPPLQRLFMHHAMGILGDTPRLARGEKL